jgi:hypothetical protein
MIQDTGLETAKVHISNSMAHLFDTIRNSLLDLPRVINKLFKHPEQ